MYRQESGALLNRNQEHLLFSLKMEAATRHMAADHFPDRNWKQEQSTWQLLSSNWKPKEERKCMAAAIILSGERMLG